MAAKSWEADFRYAAIVASLEQIPERDRSDIFNHDGSFVVPIAEKPIVGITPGKVFIAALILGFTLMGTGLLLHGKVERDANRGQPGNPMLDTIAMTLSLGGLALCLVPMTMGQFILRQLLGHRGAELQQRHGQLTSAELSHADMAKIKLSIDGDDYVLILADADNRRLSDRRRSRSLPDLFRRRNTA